MKDQVINKLIGLLSENFESFQLEMIREAALIALEEFEVDRKSVNIVPYSSIDIDIYKMFLVAKKVEGCTERTLQYYGDELKKFREGIGKPIPEIKTDDIRLYIAKLAIERGVSAVTQNNVLRILRSFFGWCTAEEYVPRNPTLKMKKIKTPKRIKKAFSEMEIEKIRNAARDKRERAVIEVLLSTGVRVGEIEFIQREDITGDSIIVYGKGQKERYVYLNAKAQLAIREYLKERNDDNPYLFVGQAKPHNRLKQSWYESNLRDLGRSIGIENVHPHRFRRTAATLALNRGMPIEQVQQMLGHTEIQTTLIYAQSAQENVKISHKKYVT